LISTRARKLLQLTDSKPFAEYLRSGRVFGTGHAYSTIEWIASRNGEGKGEKR
jgi:hypothetical protein